MKNETEVINKLSWKEASSLCSATSFEGRFQNAYRNTATKTMLPTIIEVYNSKEKQIIEKQSRIAAAEVNP